MKPINWKCPFCNQNATIKDDNMHETSTVLTIDNFEGNKELFSYFFVCPNEDCKKYTLTSILYDTKYDYKTGEYKAGKLNKKWNLIPQSNAKPFPDYIPKAIIDDYNETCSIINLSPKAAATLARRCLQGMIRDFHGVKKGRLIDEINAIEEITDPLTWKSIDSVRKIGNIGAHMEKDINLIIDVDPKEADILVQLIEQLLTDWYIGRKEREDRLKSIIAISVEKENTKKGKKSI